MNAQEFNQALHVLSWRKVDAASRLDISKGYVTQLACADAPVPEWIANALNNALDAVLAARKVGYGV